MLPAPADFDLPRHSHYSGVIPMVFQHSGGRDFDLSRHSHYSGVIPRWCFNIVPLAPVRSLPSSFVRLQQFVCETFQFGPRETSQFVPRYVRCETSSVRSAKSHTQSGRTAKSHKRSGRTAKSHTRSRVELVRSLTNEVVELQSLTNESGRTVKSHKRSDQLR